MKKIVLFLVLTSALASQAVAAPAAKEKASKDKQPAETKAQAVTASNDFKAGDWMVRVRGLGVIPQESSNINIADKVKVDNTYVPEVDLTYFFTPNIAVEAIAATTKHEVTTKGGANAGSAWLLPPTVTLQYHVNELNWIKPYVGAGVNYTHFYDAKGGALGDATYSDSFGPALQAGFDVPLGGNWYANADVKKLWIHTTAKFAGGAVRSNVDIDPVLAGVGIGYKF